MAQNQNVPMGQGVVGRVEGNTLILEVDLNGNFLVNDKGNVRIASSGGFIPVLGATNGAKLNLNVIRKA